MPRPSKHVSPDTLGGFIRAARERQHLSLAEVADGSYSTSLISQIERNRVDPSAESLHFLAVRLDLDAAELRVLAQQHRETEVEAAQYRSFDALRGDAARQLADGRVPQALALLEQIHFARVPSLQRWRLSALRGRCYLLLKRFDAALDDLVYATREEPVPFNLPEEQKLERLLLHLQLANTYHHLQHWDQALTQFDRVLGMVSRETSFGYVAETHWGMALVALMQAQQISHQHNAREVKLLFAQEHAEQAHSLYRSIQDFVYATSSACTIAEILCAQNCPEHARQILEELLYTRKGELQAEKGEVSQELASAMAKARSLLAQLEYSAGRYEQALEYAREALAGVSSEFPSSRADILVVLGQSYAALRKNTQAEQSFCQAIRELENTDLLASRINAHIFYGRYLHNAGQTTKGQQELDEAQRLAATLQAVEQGGAKMCDSLV